mmetsp:Transcript_31529/g.102733  ORF Transcript_31529/g.102733 Transcript_31529/m.102733 type:complete len:556 (-) Transcript_31529:2236-3903(-)
MVVSFALKASIAEWLRRRGKALRPELSREQRVELRDCFSLIDTDGSGAIDADELQEAFKVLGLKFRRADIERILSEIGDGTGVVEFPEFIEIMTAVDQKKKEAYEKSNSDHEASGRGSPPKERALPFHLLATAYRRKKILEGVINEANEDRALLIAKARKQTELARLRLEDAERTAKASTHAKMWQDKAAGQANSITSSRVADAASSGGRVTMAQFKHALREQKHAARNDGKVAPIGEMAMAQIAKRNSQIFTPSGAAIEPISQADGRLMLSKAREMRRRSMAFVDGYADDELDDRGFPTGITKCRPRTVADERLKRRLEHASEELRERLGTAEINLFAMADERGLTDLAREERAQSGASHDPCAPPVIFAHGDSGIPERSSTSTFITEHSGVLSAASSRAGFHRNATPLYRTSKELQDIRPASRYKWERGAASLVGPSAASAQDGRHELGKRLDRARLHPTGVDVALRLEAMRSVREEQAASVSALASEFGFSSSAPDVGMTPHRYQTRHKRGLQRQYSRAASPPPPRASASASDLCSHLGLPDFRLSRAVLND